MTLYKLSLRLTLIVFCCSISVTYAQEYKIHLIDSLVKVIKKDSRLVSKTTFDSVWHTYPDGPHYSGRFARKSFFDKTGNLKEVRVDKITYYYHSEQLIKVETKPPYRLSIYYDGSQMIKSSITQYPDVALRTADDHLRLSKIYFDRFLREKQ